MSICVHGKLCRDIYKKTGYIYSCTCPNNCKHFEELLSQKQKIEIMCDKAEKYDKLIRRNGNDR